MNARLVRVMSDRYRAIVSYSGLMFILTGLLMLTPLFVLSAWPQEIDQSGAFLIPAAVLLLMGLILRLLFRPRRKVVLSVQEGGIIVVISWVVACVFSAIPFMLLLGFNFTQAVFESVSGWSTTGLTLVDVLSASHLILIWRSITQYAGGAGLAIIMLSAITGPSGTGLAIAEGRTDQLVPHVRESAKRVMILYLGYAIYGIIAYVFAGMPVFDAVNHSMTAVATGGFSTRPESIGYWDSALIDSITITLMILGNLNFLTAYLILKGKLGAVYRNGEIRVLFVSVCTGAFLILLFGVFDLYPTFSKALRVSVFECVSAISGCGFTSTVYTSWRGIGYLVLTILMIIGGATCSTSGGLKQYRVYLLYKTVSWEIRKAILPPSAVIENYVWQGDGRDYIRDKRVVQAAAYIYIYILSFLIGTAVLACYGHSMTDAMFEFASAQGTVGLTVGITRIDSPGILLWTEIFGMFLGRLEFFIVFVSLLKVGKDLAARLRRR